jgi:hypothetical protein
MLRDVIRHIHDDGFQKVLSPQQDRLMFSLTALLAILLALVISVVLALCLPTWASVSIALAAVVTVAIGGGALLAKASIAGVVVAAVVWLARRHLQRRADKRITADVKWLAIPEVKKKEPKSSERGTERRAA